MTPTLDAAELRRAFPVLAKRIDDRPIVYLDAAATSPRLQASIDAVRAFEENNGMSARRAKYPLAEAATDALEQARAEVARWFDADLREVVFTSGATHAANLVALGLDATSLSGDDNIVSTRQEHHALLLPLQGPRLRLAPVGADGVITVDALAPLLDAHTRLVAFAHGSNVSGAVQDVSALVAEVRRRAPHARVLLDVAQTGLSHAPSCRGLDVDYMMVSAHKLGGPTGVGALIGRAAALSALRPVLRGGGAVRIVREDSFVLHEPPHGLEPGTPNVAGAIGFAAALATYDRLGRAQVADRLAQLAAYAWTAISAVAAVRVLGPPPPHRLPIVSIVPPPSRMNTDQLGEALGLAHGICVRAGHHCCHPYFDGLGLAGALRVSCGVFNDERDIDTFVTALRVLLGDAR